MTETGRSMDRCVGLEQELFLVDEEGVPSDRADEFLERCKEKATAEGLDPEGFVGECSRGMVEINAPPARAVADLAKTHLTRLDLALRAARETGVRLYPLATYPLPTEPSMREDPSYEVQARTLGRRRFMHAARCIGAHLHLELPRGTMDPDEVVSPDAPDEAREELLNLYNLGTALDPAVVALTRACPFYEGRAPGFATRVAFYRGSPFLGCEGLYTHVPEVGELRPYARSTRELVDLQLATYMHWLRAMDRAGVDRDLYFETGGNVLKTSWNPVRPNKHDTVELRSIDGNYPTVVLAVAALVAAAAARIREEGLTVTPDTDARVFATRDNRLLVPGFSYLGKDLSFAAATTGTKDPAVSAYLDSIIEFAAPYGADFSSWPFASLRTPESLYETTEAAILRGHPGTVLLSTEEGLRLVRAACGTLEGEVSSLLAGAPAPEHAEGRA